MKTALAIIQKINIPLPPIAMSLVASCVKIVAANTKTVSAKSEPDLGDKDPQGAGIDALINASTLPQAVKDALLEKFKNGNDQKVKEMGIFLNKLETFYKNHKDDKAYFEAQKTTIEGLMITLIKENGAELSLPIVPAAKNTNPVNDLTNGVEYKKVPLNKRIELERFILFKFKRGRLEARVFKYELNFTFALDKNMFLQHKTLINERFTPDFVINFFKLSNTSSWGLDGGKTVQQIANAVSLGDARFEVPMGKYFKAIFKVEGPKLSSFLEDNKTDNAMSEFWRANPVSISASIELNGQPAMLAILNALFSNSKMDLNRVFDATKCTVAGEAKIETELFFDLNVGRNNDKQKVDEVSKKANINKQKSDELAEIVQKNHRTIDDQKNAQKLSHELWDNNKAMVEIKDEIKDKAQKEVAEKMIKEGGERFIAKIGRKVLLKFIPGLNVISTVMDVIDLFSALNSYFTNEHNPSPRGERLDIDTVDDLKPENLVPPHLKKR
jgi:hypothetical protein